MKIERKSYLVKIPTRLFTSARERAFKLEKTFLAYLIGLIEEDLKKVEKKDD
jgi:hypothetical protein